MLDKRKKTTLIILTVAVILCLAVWGFGQVATAQLELNLHWTSNYTPIITPSVKIVQTPRYALALNPSSISLSSLELGIGVDNFLCSLNVTGLNDQGVTWLNVSLTMNTFADQKITLLREFNQALMTQTVTVGLNMYIYVLQTNSTVPIERTFNQQWTLTLPWNPTS